MRSVPAEARTQSAYSGVKHTNHEAMANCFKGRCFNNAVDAKHILGGDGILMNVEGFYVPGIWRSPVSWRIAQEVSLLTE